MPHPITVAEFGVTGGQSVPFCTFSGLKRLTVYQIISPVKVFLQCLGKTSVRHLSGIFGIKT